MKYFDEKIAKIREELQQEQREEEKVSRMDQESINEGIKNGELIIDDQKFLFFNYKFHGEAIQMMIPEGFGEMEEEYARRKFPSELRPKLILTDDSGMFNITLSVTENRIGEGTVEQLTYSLLNMVKRAYPHSPILSDGVEALANDHQVGYFELVSPTIDGEIYQFMFVTIFRTYITQGSILCDSEDMEFWKRLARGMFQTLTIKE